MRMWIILVLLLLTGCGSTKEAVKKPLWSLSGTVKFEKITLVFTQDRLLGRDIYPPKEDIERRLNEGIHEGLMREGLLDPTSQENLLITVNFNRVFMGGGGPAAFRSDRLASPKLGYELQIIRDEKELRKIRKMNLVYDLGFIGNVKYLLMLSQGSEREDMAIQALSKEIVEDVKKLYSPKMRTEENPVVTSIVKSTIWFLSLLLSGHSNF